MVFFLACEVGFKMPSHLQWPSWTVSSGASTKTIPPPLLHYFGKVPERRPVKDRCLLSHVWVRHIWSQLHAIVSSSHVSFQCTVSRSTFFLRSTHSTYLLAALNFEHCVHNVVGCEFTYLLYQRVPLVLPFNAIEEHMFSMTYSIYKSMDTEEFWRILLDQEVI